ncbi:MAG TPA: response regulator [Myxococcales bacterium]|jgi:two-component system chemotaxis response regulator CheY|nr:response regulator [Myxococcales bacterium]
MARVRAGERLVLVVDDDPDILQTLGLCLSSEGYRVLMAANGKEALEILDHEHPSVILLDLMMPVMDGWQFVAELDHRGRRDVPLLILSADRAVQGHAQQLRASGHLAKPFDLDDLLGKVQQLTGGAMAN